MRRDLIYWFALALAAGSTLVVVLVMRSRLGLALRAVRDDIGGARGLGVDVTKARLVVWVMAAGWTGVTGALIHLNTATVTNRDAFSVLSWTALVIFIVIIGGVGSTTGPVIGVAVFWFISDQFEAQDTWRFIILGAVAVAMAVMAPKGLHGLLQRWRPVQFFPVRGPPARAGAWTPDRPPTRRGRVRNRAGREQMAAGRPGLRSDGGQAGAQAAVWPRSGGGVAAV